MIKILLIQNLSQVKTFMDAVDDVISVQDFLSVVENHILEDVKSCCKAHMMIVLYYMI